MSVAAGATLLGLAPIGMRLSELGPQATAFWRFAFALPVLAVLAWRLEARAPESGDVRGLSIAGVCFGLDIALWHWALDLTTVANATLMSNMTPIIAVVAGWLIFKERIGPNIVFGAGVALAGAALLCFSRAQGGQGELSGDLLGLFSALWYGIYLILMRGIRTRVRAAMAMTVTTFTALLTAACATVIAGERWLPDPTWRNWAVLIGLGVVVHAGAQGLIAYGLGRLPITVSTVVLWMQPLSAAVLSWVLFGEYLGGFGFVGAAMILAGIYVVQRART
jgi:drug/metabolite transporter (DMT)-like permease